MAHELSFNANGLAEMAMQVLPLGMALVSTSPQEQAWKSG